MPQVQKEITRTQLIAELDREFSKRGIRRRRRARLWRSSSWLVALRLVAGLRRLADFFSATLLLAVLSPLLAALFISTKRVGGGIGTQLTLGRWAIPFNRYRFDFTNAKKTPSWANSSLSKLPALVNAVRGEMSLIGPRPVHPNELAASERNAWKRFDTRPGFLSVWRLRQRGNIDYARETDIDAEYVETQTLSGDLGIALRSLPAFALGGSASNAPDHVTLLGIPITNLSMSEAVDRIVTLALANDTTQVCFVNADCVNLAVRDAPYKITLQNAELVLADGIGVRLAGQLLNRHIRQNVNGTDLLPLLCSIAASKGLGIYLLGGHPGVAEAAAKWMQQRCPDLRISGTRNGYFTAEDESAIVNDIRISGAHILLVALGAPKQEEWIADHKSSLNPGVCLGVGGLFDFYSGRIPRAPIWMREIGLEWFYRFLQEPGRMWRRYFLGNAIFLLRVLAERLRNG